MKDNDIILSVRNLSKRYEIYDRPVKRLWQMLFAGRKNFYREFWALKDINFEIRRGECWGIIGRNGAGKSTLLKLITGTLQATSGKVWKKPGLKIAALLELGSGFNPEFTGRENVYLNASILGLSRAETAKHYQEIIDFADIGDFIDQPVKKYSSGMKMRLAFAVQIMVRPDVMIVDEALAVGDMFFQQKCMHYMRKLKESGCALFFVSHAIGTVRSLCDRAVLLQKGRMVAAGAAEDICNMYWDMNLVTQKKSAAADAPAGDNKAKAPPPKVAHTTYSEDPLLASKISERTGDGRLRFVGFSLRDESGKEVTCAMRGEKLTVVASVKANADVPVGTAFAMSFNTKNEPGVTTVCSLQHAVTLPALKAGARLVIETTFVSIFKQRRIALNFSLKPEQRGRNYYDHVYTGAIFDAIYRPEDEADDIGGVFFLPVEKMKCEVIK